MKRFLLLLVLCCLLFSSCAPGKTVPVESTVSDKPLKPSFSETAEIWAENTPEERAEPVLPTMIPYEINGYGFDGDLYLDGDGIYYRYTGGEMSITTFHQGRGLQEKGVAILLYVDGQPQPYHTNAEPEDGYLHRIYPENGKETYTELFFTPRTGQAGDVKEICVISFADPDYFITDGPVPFALRPYCSVIRMKYEATPPECSLPVVEERLLSLSVTTEERASAWNQAGEIFWNFSVNERGTGGSTLKNISRSKPLNLRFRLWGDPVGEFGVIFYVDHQPVSVLPENALLVQAKEGQQLIVEAQVDISDFDGSSIVYAVLVPRNYRSAELGTSCEPNTSGIFYLIGEE